MISLHFSRKSARWGVLFCLSFVLLGLCLLSVSPRPVLASDGPGTGPGGVGATDGTSNLRLWLRADAGVYQNFTCSTPAVNGTVVACWADQSGSGNDVKQDNSDYYPVYLSTPAIRFNGSTAMLSSEALQLFAEADSGLMAIVVFNTTDRSGPSYLLNHGAANGESLDNNFELGYGIGSGDTVGNFGLHRGSSHATIAPTDTITNNARAILSTRVLSTGVLPTDSVQIYKNGVSLTLDTSGAGWLTAGHYATSTVPLDIGARRDGNDAAYPDDVTPDAHHAGDIVEIILYTEPLNTAQRIIIENYLSAKYGVPLAAGTKYYWTPFINYIQDVAGIGREADGMHTEANSAGLILVDSGFLQDNGDYLLAGHRMSTNGITTGDLASLNGVASRWERIWQFDRTDVNEGDGVTLKFDFDDAGIAETPEGIYTLLSRSKAGSFTAASRASSYTIQDQVIFSDVTGLVDGYYYTLGKFEDAGYDLFDSNQPGGPVYDFENITETGTLITFTDKKQITGTFPIGFSFNFYGEDYTQFYVGTDGFLTFLAGQDPGSGLQNLPSAASPNGLVAALWKALYPHQGGSIHYKTESSPNRFILQFTDVPQSPSGGGLTTFQIKLFETSNIIEVHYKDIPAGAGDHSAGIENQTGDQGLQYYYAAGALTDLSVRYVPRPLLLHKAVNVTTPRVGDRITYTLRVHSNLMATTTGTVISDMLDTGLILDSDAITITPAQLFDLVIVGQTLTASNFSLVAGEKVTLTVPVTVGVTVPPGTHLVNTATVTHPVLSQPVQDTASVVADNCWANVDGVVYDKVQTAVDAADPGDLVKVAGYCVDVEARGALWQTVYLSKTLTLRGGYAPVLHGIHYTVTNWTVYSSTLNPTTLDAQMQGRVVYVGEGGDLTVEGLRLTGGDAGAGGAVDFDDVEGALGGGVFAYSATVTMSDTLVYGNSAGGGGGLYVYTGTLALDGSQIFSNTADNGGGVYLNDTRAVTMSEMLIFSNTATSGGGGMRLDGVRHIVSVGNLLRGNTASEGGGLYLSRSTLLLTDLTVLSNSAQHGGGIYGQEDSTQIRALSVMSNTATGNGGGLHLNNSGTTLDGITVTHNFARQGGGGYFATSHSAVLTNTYVAHNAASSGGGGWYVNGSNATLRGNMILSNTATGPGGGFYVNGGAPTLHANTVVSNVAADKGGGIYSESSDATLSSNRIEANSTSNTTGYKIGGGGMHIFKGNPLLNENEFLSNTVAGNGGGLYLRQTGATLSGNTIALNTASQGSGVYLDSNITLILRENAITNNAASTNGGGLYAESGTVTLESNTFSANIAAVGGGGAYLATNVTLTRNKFEANEAYQGGGLYVSGPSTLDGNIVFNNEALLSGGGLYMYKSTATLINTVVASNVVSDGYGSGLYINGSTPNLLHTTVALNAGGDESGAYVTGASQATFTNTILVSQTTGLKVTSGGTGILHSVLRYGNTTDWGGDGTFTVQGVNIHQPPDFVDPDNDDFHLNINSPAIDAGVDSSVTVDMDGNARPRNAGYDLGADEYDGTCFARLNDADYFYATIQEAVDASASATDEIKVAGVCAGVQNRLSMTQTVYINKSLTVRGGYTLTDWTVSNPIFNPTTLDAQGAGRVVYVTGSANVTLEALRVIGGNAATGGGVYADDVSLTLSKVWLTGNNAGRGGAVYLDAGNATLVNAMIVENQASQYGGGLYSRASSPVLMHTTFARNTGGGIYVTDDGAVYSAAVFTNTVLVSHTVGITVTAGSTVMLDATLWGSDSWSNGIDIDGAGTVYSTTNYTGDPAFIAPDALNYHINAASAALDKGIDIGVEDDVDGDERPYGATKKYDLGADEFAASFVVTKRASPDPALAGDSILYTIDVVNTGAVDLVATIRDTLPDHVTPGGELVWPDESITAFGDTWTTQFAVTVDADYSGTLTNTGFVTTELGITRYFTEPVTVNAEVDLSITKSANVSEASASQPVTYTLNYVNAGPSTAFDVLISDTIPSMLLNVTVARSGAAITPTGSVSYTWEVEPLVEGEGGTIIVVGVLDSGFPDGFVFTNTATIASTTPDRTPSNNASAAVTITMLNTPPVAQDDTASTDEDTPVTIPVLDNDDDADGDPLIVMAVFTPAHGSATTNAETIAYTPTLNFYGADTFSYTVGDGSDVDTALVTVTVSPLNDRPEANDDQIITNKNRAKEIDVLGNDQDVDDDSLTIIAVGTPGHGTASTDGLTVIYTPTTDYFGPDGFDYTISDGELTDSALVTVTVLEASNQPPVAVDDEASTLEGTMVIISVLDNDSDPELDILSIVDVGTPAHGTAVIGVDNLIYTPTAGFIGTDSFDYTISDGDLTDSALVTITVYSAVNRPPVAKDDVIGTSEGTPVTIRALDNDTDPDEDALSLIAVDTPTNGAASIVGDTVIYTPDSGFTGLDSFDYTISDGDLTDSALITVTVYSASNTPPQAVDDAGMLLEDASLTLNVLTNDIDVDSPILFITHIGTPLHGLAESLTYDSIAYTPNPDFNGTDTFTYTVSDGEYDVEASVTVTVTAVNDAPAFIPGVDPVTVVEDAELQTLSDWATGISAGPADEAGQALVFTLTHVATNLFTLQPALDVTSGALTFTPAPDANGSTVITATLWDDGGTANGGIDAFAQTFTLVITPVEDAPRFTSTPVTAVGVDVAYTYAVTATDADAGDTLTITAPIKPAWLSLSGSGGSATLTGTPSESDIGQHAVTLEVRDTTGLMDTQSFSITVGIAPELVATMPADGAQQVDLTASVVITFSEEIDANTFAYAVVPDPGGWVGDWSSDGTAVTLDHTPFEPATDYTVTLTAVHNVDGIPMATLPYSWLFRTAPAGYEIYLPLVLRNSS